MFGVSTSKENHLLSLLVLRSMNDAYERTDNDTLVSQSYAMLSVCTPLQYFWTKSLRV